MASVIKLDIITTGNKFVVSLLDFHWLLVIIFLLMGKFVVSLLNFEWLLVIIFLLMGKFVVTRIVCMISD